MTSKPYLTPPGVSFPVIPPSLPDRSVSAEELLKRSARPVSFPYAPFAAPLTLFAQPRFFSDQQASWWCQSGLRRVFDAGVAACAIALLAPLLLLIAIWVRVTSPGPAIFRQERVGWCGQTFTILKFRTMVDAPDGPKRSSTTDQRITPIGKVLRRYKLDELPQLINVVRGEMSLIGPRPKLAGHQSRDTHFRPGLTGAATLAFASEEHLLRHVPEQHLEDCHRVLITPRKLELDLAYMAQSTFRSDLRLMWLTIRRSGRYGSLSEVGEWVPPVPASEQHLDAQI